MILSKSVLKSKKYIIELYSLQSVFKICHKNYIFFCTFDKRMTRVFVLVFGFVLFGGGG